ncbi:MAG: ATP-binding cassette domain-containing protein, partial [Bacteroidota bacterium]
EWLEGFLSTSKQSLLLVTHDRYFLDSITNEIFELENGSLYTYKGNYAYFLEKKMEREMLQDKEREKAASLFKTELEWLRRSPKARTSKSKSRIESATALGEKARNFRDTSQLNLQVQGRRIGGNVMEIKKLRKAFGEVNIVDDFTYTFKKRERIGIAGPNGVGKTTFINMLLGTEAQDSGKIRVGETIHFGYYRQSGLEFKEGQRIIEVVTEAAEQVSYTKSESISAATLLEYFLFPRHRHYQRVETLSGGEKRRLHLLRVLMTNPNFLVLDEPTNDLDLITLQRLEEFLLNFDGILMVVSHDRYFMDRLIDHLWVFEGDGKIKDFPGSYSQYTRWQLEQQAEAEKPKQPSTPVTEAAPATRQREKTKLSYKEQREFEQLETEIDAMETRKAELDELLGSGETDFEKLTTWSEELTALKSDLEAKSDRWLELSEFV